MKSGRHYPSRQPPRAAAFAKTGEFDVAVVGAGVVGAAFALGCAQAGIDVLSIAVAPTPKATGNASTSIAAEPWDRRVYALSPASKRFLDELKVWPRLDASRIAPVYDMCVFGGAFSGLAAERGHGALHFSAYQAGVDALAWIVEHRELMRVLDAALSFQHGTTQVFAHADSYSATVERVQIQTPQATYGARLVVGADGAHSGVRKHLEATAGLKTDVKHYGQIGVVANFACGDAHGGTAYQWFDDEAVIALLPLPGQAAALVWSAPEALAQQLLAATPDELARRVEAIAGGVLGPLTPLGGASGFPLERLSTSRQTASRFALIGDAAHVVHPLAGQGLNLGLQDAAALCEVLGRREPFRDCGDARLLRRYERTRSAPVSAMLWTTDGLQRTFSTDGALMQAVRSSGMNWIDRLPVIKSMLIRHAMG